MPLDVEAQFQTHRARVYRWAMTLLRRHDDALDIVQDVFLRMVRRPPEPRGDHAIVGWLRRATVSATVDLWRRRAARPEGEDASPRLVSHDASPEDREQARHVRAALATLSDQQRLVLVCKACDGMTFQAIADELGIAVSTAKTHYVRGLEAIRVRLDAESPKARSLS